ncbi:MAG: hypothetical protein OHK005_06850 [Candidatus Methylacidiphilales bacterium]
MNLLFRTVPLPGGDWTLADTRNGEVFHPRLGAEREAELLYVRPWGLRQALAQPSSDPVVVWDIGLGAAGNAAAVLHCWREVGARPLELWSFDRNRDALAAAKQFRENHPDSFNWLQDLPPELFAGVNRFQMENPEGQTAVWQVVEDDFVGWAARQPTGSHRPFLAMVDLYSPEASVHEWTLSHWRNIRRSLAEDAATRFVFHSRSTAVRVTLLLAGFWVGRGPSLGAKEETTVAALSLDRLSEPLGQAFLDKVCRSTNSAPFLADGHDRRGPIGESDRVTLLAHPQFNSNRDAAESGR